MTRFALRGDICTINETGSLMTVEDGFVICVDGISQGVFDALPDAYAGIRVIDHRGKLILPGLVDLHMHAPQYAGRGLGMDLELLDWLNTRTYPAEARYADIDFARAAYRTLAHDLRRGPNARVVLFSTRHVPATVALMDEMEESGLVSFVGKVNMDRNAPDGQREVGWEQSMADTRAWLADVQGRYRRTSPILTPRFIPSCSDELMTALGALRRETGLPVQSHLSENLGEIEWVKQLCPQSDSYLDAYDRFDLLDGGAPKIMAHCVFSDARDFERLKARGVIVAHCPQSNINLRSGIAPLRKMLRAGVQVGLGSDVAGGCHTSIFRAMTDAVQVSKLYWRLVDQEDAPLSMVEAFALATVGGGAFFGKVGSLGAGYEFDALVLDDRPLEPPGPVSVRGRMERAAYLSDDRHILEKYVRGQRVTA